MSRSEKTGGALPPSDVPAIVGLLGLGGLFAWLAICRFWPHLVDMFGFPGPHMRLDGPYASVVATFCCALPMVAWSLLVEKVHRNPSTGIDWDNPRPVSAIIDISITKIAGLWATWAVIGFLYCIARYYWDGQYRFSMEMMGMLAIPLFLLSVPYVIWLDRMLKEPRDHAWHFGAMLIGREPYCPEHVRSHWRAWAVKGFFTAFMISILPGGWYGLVNAEPDRVFSDPVAFSSMLIEMCFVFDVQIGMVGYLLTLRPLDAHIRSANPYLAGWVAALLCYPPFNMMGSGPLDYHVNASDWSQWFGGHTIMLWVWGAILVLLTAIYAWATVAFGLRFSNLTYRGVLTNGPYRFTRHPAYLSKNAFWWFSTVPFIAATGLATDAVRNTVLLALVSSVYYWRAKTEEKHLLAEDPKYREYHTWMEQNALITRSLSRLKSLIRPRGPRMQPAE
jgi:protein-S-isoprenylcysteine O-methyltransferase Ste14